MSSPRISHRLETAAKLFGEGSLINYNALINTPYLHCNTFEELHRQECLLHLFWLPFRRKQSIRSDAGQFSVWPVIIFLKTLNPNIINNVFCGRSLGMCRFI